MKRRLCILCFSVISLYSIAIILTKVNFTANESFIVPTLIKITLYILILLFFVVYLKVGKLSFIVAVVVSIVITLFAIILDNYIGVFANHDSFFSKILLILYLTGFFILETLFSYIPKIFTFKKRYFSFKYIFCPIFLILIFMPICISIVSNNRDLPSVSNLKEFFIHYDNFFISNITRQVDILNDYAPLSASNLSLDYAPSIMGGEELSYYNRFYNLNNEYQLVKDADIIVFGNSRSLYGLNQYFVDLIKNKYGLNVYFLSQGHAERFAYFLEYYKKFPFKNKVLILNVDNYFFSTHLSIMGRRVIDGGIYKAERIVHGGNIKWKCHNFINSIIPLFNDNYVLARNNDSGSWIQYAYNNNTYFGKYPVEYSSESSRISPDNLKFAIDSLDLIKYNGNKIIFISVPTQKTRNYDSVKSLANEINCSYLLKEILELKTFDGSHLSQNSAKVYTNWLVDELEIMDILRSAE